MAETNGTNGMNGSASSHYPAGLLRSYLTSLLPLTLGAHMEELEALFSADDFHGDTWEEVAQPFLSNSGALAYGDDTTTSSTRQTTGNVLYVMRRRIASGLKDNDGDQDSAEADPAEGDVDDSCILELSTSLSGATGNNTQILALIKRTPTLDPNIPLPQQIHFLNVNGGGVYESVHTVISNGVKPWFDAFVGTKKSVSGGASSAEDGKMGIPFTKRKFAELELALVHLQQNVEIPETHLIIHPAISQAVITANSMNPVQRPNIGHIQPQKLLTDSSFLNTLQGHVNSWIRGIQTVTKLTRDVSSGTASQEINFWLSLEKALEAIEAQLRSEEVLMVMEVLRNAKRFHATVSFHADTGLKDAVERAHKYNALFKDFPLNELLSATDLAKVQEAVILIFGHMNRRLRLSPYPIRSALPLVEAISRDFNEALVRILTSHRLPYLSYDQFEKVVGGEKAASLAIAAAASSSSTTSGPSHASIGGAVGQEPVGALGVCKVWEEQIKEFTNVAREVTRKRSEKFIPIKVQPAHAKLQERIRYLREWRKQHEQLAVMTSGHSSVAAGFVTVTVKGGVNELGIGESGMDMEEEVKEAYEVVKRIDVLDVSTEGTEIWVAAENGYNERVSRVENQIIARLRDRLGTARNANEMFRVFSRFNALFVRPKIRGAIQEYQTQLIDSVKEDIKHLHDKFKTQYRSSEAYHMAQMRDLPPIAGAIIWAKQIERQLVLYMKRVEDVLGKGWELYAEGQRLQAESTAFRRKLDTRPVFDAWLHDIGRRNLAIDGRLFEITRVRAAVSSSAPQVTTFNLAVNFDPQIITLFKEVRNMLWLNFSVPHSISNQAKDAKRVYPHAVSLMETVRTYTQTLDLIEKNSGIEWLVAEYRNEAQRMIARGMGIRWDYFVNNYDTGRFIGTDGRGDNRHVQFVREFASVVSVLQDKTNNVIDLYKDILRAIQDLSTCSYATEAFSDLLSKIQAAIDRLNLEGYANLEHWVADLDKRIEAILLNRVRQIIQLWCREFDKTSEDAERDLPLKDITNKRRGEKRKEEKSLDGNMTLKPIVYEIRIQNQVIFLDPPIEHARANWVKQLHDWLGIVCNLRRIQSSRYEIGLQMHHGEVTETNYTSLLTHFTDDTLRRPFALIEAKTQEIRDYVGKWLQFQSLWDLEAEYVFNRLGEDLAQWQQLLTEIKKARSTFDTSDTSKSFGGVCVIDYEQVQSRVNAKYDSWQKDILNRFGIKLGNAMKEMHASILKARNELEQQRF
ncbi:dynein heavy chain, N-terminal region 1-domain-containing protein [Flagelloscypha sp. PMI_526]|nr:dynein heavy chain, N-terminal region 1-domain-containing protein [Flagelloscypha sp. PMI_526]